MAPASYFFVFFLLSRLLLPHSADEEPKCPLYCGDPPKRKDSDDCWLLTVDNCTAHVDKIQVEWEGNSYDVESIFPADTIDFDICRSYLQESCVCETPEKLINFSCSPISFKTTSNLTNIQFNRAPTTPLQNFSYSSCSVCNDLHQKKQKPPSPHCFSTHPPTQLDDHHFSLSAADIFFRVNVSSTCCKCFHKGFEYKPDSRFDNIKGFVQCHTQDKGHNNSSVAGHNHHRGLKIALGLGLGLPIGLIVAALIICLLIFFIRRHHYKQKNASSGFLMRNISDDPASKSELDRGDIYFRLPIFSYSELEEATNDFDPTKELGDGGFGTVYYGKLQDGREVAVKRLYENSYKRVEQFMNEVEILAHLHHKNLVSLYGCTSRHSRELLLVYEFIPNGTVADHLHGDRAKHSSLTWSTRMSIAIETAEALVYLHATDIIHRDVKTNNILLDNNFCVKVADFGLSRLFPIDCTHISTAPQGTPGYLDPEYHQSYQLTDKSDVYSFGVVLIELISSLPAVDISRHRHEINLANLAINKIQNCAFNELVDSCLGFESNPVVRRMMTSVAELAFRCLQHDKEMRPYMDEVLEVLKGIQSEVCKVEMDGNVGVMKCTKAPFLSDSDTNGLLKKMQLSHSSNSVTEKQDRWPNRPNASI